MNEFVHLRHKPPTELAQPRELVLAMPPMRSNVNVARIIRAAACSGVSTVIACGNVKIDPRISREGEQHLDLQIRRSLLPVVQEKLEVFLCLLFRTVPGRASYLQFQDFQVEYHPRVSGIVERTTVAGQASNSTPSPSNI